jgi:hypothetical protein
MEIQLFKTDSTLDKFNDRGLHLFGINSIALCLLLVVIFISNDHMIVMYVATCFVVALVNAGASLKLAWVANSLYVPL